MDSATLAQWSNTAVYSAMLVYTGALGAFVTDLARLGAARPSAVKTRDATLVAVPGGGSDAAAVGTASTADAAVLPDDESAAPRRNRVAGIAVSLTWLALVLHLAAVLARGLSVQRAPWGNMYEFSLTGSMVVTAVFLLVLRRRPDIRFLGTFIVGPVLLALGLAISVFYTAAGQLVPALDSYWLIIHVSVAFIATALFTLGFSTTVLQLIQQRRERVRTSGGTPRGAFMDALPTARSLERLAYQLYVAAFPLWGFTLIAGAIWAERSWGRYWNWDPKEIWTFVIWVVYAAYLHARATKGWDGRTPAYLAVAGYVCLMMNFTVINYFAQGLHSYA